MSFVGWNLHSHSTPVATVTCTISYYIGSCYNDTQLTVLCYMYMASLGHCELKLLWPEKLWSSQKKQQMQGCQPVRNFRILYGFYMQNTGVQIWPTKYGNWALSVLSLKGLLSEQSLPVFGSKSVKICGILCLKTFKYLFNHQDIQTSLFHMW